MALFCLPPSRPLCRPCLLSFLNTVSLAFRSHALPILFASFPGPSSPTCISISPRKRSVFTLRPLPGQSLPFRGVSHHSVPQAPRPALRDLPFQTSDWLDSHCLLSTSQGYSQLNLFPNDLTIFPCLNPLFLLAVANFVCQLDEPRSLQIQHCFWLYLWSCFWMRQHLNPADSVREMVLPVWAGDTSLLRVWTDKRRRKEESAPFFPAFLLELGYLIFLYPHLGFTPLVPLVLRPSDSDWVIPSACLGLQLIDPGTFPSHNCSSQFLITNCLSLKCIYDS